MSERGVVCIAAVAASLLLASASAALAQARCDAGSSTMSAARPWTPPLGRALTLHDRDVSLRTALDRIAEAARVRLSYSADLLPLDRHVCLSFNAVAIGDALAVLLDGTNVAPVVAGADHIVLAPLRAAAPTSARPAAVDTLVFPVDPVIAIASRALATQTASPLAADVIERSELEQRAGATLAQMLNGRVPGVWIWSGSAARTLSLFGNMRGASSFGLSAPKIYIDGIAMANPLLLARLSPEAIDRIEVIRGPQGAALYGADAIGGVTNIVTRRGNIAGTPRILLGSDFGVSATDYAPGSPLQQDHLLGLRLGSDSRSAALDLRFGSTGEFIPGALARHLSTDASVQLVGARTTLSGTLRYYAERTGTPLSPLFSETTASLLGPRFSSSGMTDPLAMQQYTVGINASYQQNARWTHSLVVGVDGYTLVGGSNASPLLLSPADSVVRAAGAGGRRATFRLGTSAQLITLKDATASLSLAAERSLLSQDGDVLVLNSSVEWPAVRNQPESRHTGWPSGNMMHAAQPHSAAAFIDAGSSSTGLSAQLTTAFFNRIYFTGGLRAERLDVSIVQDRTVLLPTLGASWLSGSDGAISLKLRAAYGKGIRWPQLPMLAGTEPDPTLRPSSSELEPEQQTGIEAGFDLAFKRMLVLQVTRFDQTASGLIQRVAVAGDPIDPHGYEYGIVHQLQNVGEISNRGWELQASMQRGPFALSGTYSLVDSRVQQLAVGYTGDLRPGDRMLTVPAHTMGLAASWFGNGWSTSVSASRATDWINYDRLALARAHATAAEPGQDPVEAQLREYWRAYNGFTHLGAVITRGLGRGFSLTLSGENLLDRQVGEPDNVTILPGRTLSLGVRTSF